MGRRARRASGQSSGQSRGKKGLSEDMYDEVDAFHRKQEQAKLAEAGEG